MHVTAQCYSEDVLTVLADAIGIGYVHSVFRNSFNIQFGSRLINVSGSQASYPPFGVTLNDTEMKYINETIGQDQMVIWESTTKQLVFPDGNIQIKLANTHYQSQLVPMEIEYFKFVDNTSRLITFLLHSSLENGFDKDISEMVECIAGNDQVAEDVFYCQLRRLAESVLQEKLDTHVLDYWLGRGRGLTPGGDDLLLGLLAMMNACRRKQRYVREFTAYLLAEGHNRTTQIAFEYLWYAVQCKYSLSIGTLCQALLAEGNPELDHALRAVSLYGHTSGVDTLLGILLASQIILSDLKKLSYVYSKDYNRDASL